MYIKIMLPDNFFLNYKVNFLLSVSAHTGRVRGSLVESSGCWRKQDTLCPQQARKLRGPNH